MQYFFDTINNSLTPADATMAAWQHKAIALVFQKQIVQRAASTATVICLPCYTGLFRDLTFGPPAGHLPETQEVLQFYLLLICLIVSSI
jgi:hypothetical protein